MVKPKAKEKMIEPPEEKQRVIYKGTPTPPKLPDNFSEHCRLEGVA